MQHEVLYGPAYALGVTSLEAGESVQAEAGAMVSMTPGIAIETSVKGGMLSG